jgi:hypothetical protein
MPYGPGRVAVPLRGVPDGLVALTIPRRMEGELRVPRDRKQRLKPTRVDLTAAEFGAQHRDISRGDLDWLLGAERRAWPTVASRFGVDAWQTACELVRAGLIEIRCQVAGAALGSPGAVLLTAHGLAERKARLSARAENAGELRKRAEAAAALIEHLDPALAIALHRARGTDARLPVLVFAAEDLAAGRAHDGPRAFSQAHFGVTKQRDDAPSILRTVGASPATLAALGLERSPYVGLGGVVCVDGFHLSRLRGPVLFRAQDPVLTTVTALPKARALVVVENLQAAENVCDTRDDVAVVYSAGQPSNAALVVVAALAGHVPRVVVVPDADLGGVRIAARVLSALPRDADVLLVDVGEQPHEPGEPFAAATLASLESCTHGPAGALAAAVHRRGYAVEQEAVSRAAVAWALGDRLPQ